MYLWGLASASYLLRNLEPFDHLAITMAAHMMIMMHNANQRAMRRERVFRDHFNPLEGRQEVEIKARWRFFSPTVKKICDIVTPRIQHPTRRSHSLPPLLQTLCALRFYATGGYYMLVGDTQNIAEPTVCRAMWGVTEALCEVADQYIKFPTSPEALQHIQAEFFKKKGKY